MNKAQEGQHCCMAALWRTQAACLPRCSVVARWRDDKAIIPSSEPSPSFLPSLLENEPDMNECDDGRGEGMDHVQIARARAAWQRKSEPLHDTFPHMLLNPKVAHMLFLILTLGRFDKTKRTTKLFGRQSYFTARRICTVSFLVQSISARGSRLRWQSSMTRR